MISSDPDKPCIFPWGFAETMHNYEGCVNPDGDEGGNWCATEVDHNGMYVSGSGKWGYCNIDHCPHCFGGDSCCTETNQCSIGEGDCDKDIDCKGDLVCGEDNCDGIDFDGTDDCCTEPDSKYKKIYIMFCLVHMFDHIQI